jgi:hypothetical protein
MNKKGMISLISAVVIILAVIIFQKLSAPDLSSYLPLKDPAITTMKQHKMLVVEARGEPGKIGKQAFGLLFKAYFGLKGVPKGKGRPAPRCRWPISDSVPPEQWIGRYAMPLPDTVKDVRFPEVPKGLSIKIATWQYGTVAEILHVGPYDKEAPAVERLHQFIEEKGYVIAGEHEEEYLRGPGMFFKGKTSQYMTIIRYQVKEFIP